MKDQKSAVFCITRRQSVSLCVYTSTEDTYIRDAGKLCSAGIIQAMGNLQRHCLSLAHLITLLLGESCSQKLRDLLRNHSESISIPKYCNPHYNQVQPLSTSAVLEEDFFNFPLLLSTAEISRDLWVSQVYDWLL